MWKAELRLMKLYFRGPKRKNREEPEPKKSSRLDTIRQKFQAELPESLPQSSITEHQKNEIENSFEPRKMYGENDPDLPTGPTKFQKIQPRQERIDNSDPTLPPLIKFESGPFFRTLDVLTGEDEKCNEGECIASKNRSIQISPEDLEKTGDVDKSVVEGFGYFTAMIEKRIENENNKYELVPYFVHEEQLEQFTAQVISKKEDVKESGRLYIQLKPIRKGISVYIYILCEGASGGSSSGGSSSGASHIVDWLVYRNYETETTTIVHMHPKMVNFFNKQDIKQIIQIPNINTNSTTGDSHDN